MTTNTPLCDELRPLIDWLTYRSYESNRLRNPHKPFEAWRKIYKDAVIFEEIYDKNLINIFRGE